DSQIQHIALGHVEQRHRVDLRAAAGWIEVHGADAAIHVSTEEKYAVEKRGDGAAVDHAAGGSKGRRERGERESGAGRLAPEEVSRTPTVVGSDLDEIDLVVAVGTVVGEVAFAGERIETDPEAVADPHRRARAAAEQVPG